MKFFGKYFWGVSLLAGSAVGLAACTQEKVAESNDEAMMTEYSTDLSMIESKDGVRSYFFQTPLMEGYSLAKEPYREFRKGIRLITYQDDSLSQEKMVLVADYAINYTQKDLWEARGNVVVRMRDADSTVLYTQQLFWNAKTDRIYSNVDTKMVQHNGADFSIGQGFESDSGFKDWHWRKQTSTNVIDELPVNENPQSADSTSTNAAPPVPVPPKPAPKPVAPAIKPVSQPQTTPQPAVQTERKLKSATLQTAPQMQRTDKLQSQDAVKNE